jgi:hypothetical protein
MCSSAVDLTDIGSCVVSDYKQKLLFQDVERKEEWTQLFKAELSKGFVIILDVNTLFGEEMN